MYLAGLIADDAQMSKKDLQSWADRAYWSMLSEYTVRGSPPEANMDTKSLWSGSTPRTLGSRQPAGRRSVAWSQRRKTRNSTCRAEQLLQRVQKTIHQQPNRVRHVMNGFVIAVGAYVRPLTTSLCRLGRR